MEVVQTGNKPLIAVDFTVLRGLLQTPTAVATAGIRTSQWQDKTWDGSVRSKGFFHHVLPGNEFGCLWLLIEQLLSALSNLCAFKSLRSHGTASSHSPSGVAFCIGSWERYKSLLPKCASSHTTERLKHQVCAEALPKTSNYITTQNAPLLGLFSMSQPLQIKLYCALTGKRQRQRDRGILDLCSLG